MQTGASRRIEIEEGIPTLAGLVLACEPRGAGERRGDGGVWERRDAGEIVAYDAHDGVLLHVRGWHHDGARLHGGAHRTHTEGAWLAPEEVERLYAAAPDRARGRPPCRSAADREACPLCQHRAVERECAARGRVATEGDYGLVSLGRHLLAHKAAHAAAVARLRAMTPADLAALCPPPPVVLPWSW